MHPPYHKLEECPVIVNQKFLVEAAEQLRRSKGGLSSGSVTVLVPWVAHNLLRCPGHACTSSLDPTLGCPGATQKSWGAKCVLLGLYWNQ